MAFQAIYPSSPNASVLLHVGWFVASTDSGITKSLGGLSERPAGQVMSHTAPPPQALTLPWPAKGAVGGVWTRPQMAAVDFWTGGEEVWEKQKHLTINQDRLLWSLRPKCRCLKAWNSNSNPKPPTEDPWLAKNCAWFTISWENTFFLSSKADNLYNLPFGEMIVKAGLNSSSGHMWPPGLSLPTFGLYEGCYEVPTSIA